MNADRLTAFLLTAAGIMVAAIAFWSQWPWLDQIPGWGAWVFVFVQSGKLLALYVGGYAVWIWAGTEEDRWRLVGRLGNAICAVATLVALWIYLGHLAETRSPLPQDWLMEWKSMPSWIGIISGSIALICAYILYLLRHYRAILVVVSVNLLIALWVELLHPWFFPLQGP